MEDLLEQFCLTYGISIGINNLDLPIDKVYDEDFNSIDGEESDNGLIRYYHVGNLIGIQNVSSGDHSDWYYTEYGFNLLKQELFKYLDQKIQMSHIIISE